MHRKPDAPISRLAPGGYPLNFHWTSIEKLAVASLTMTRAAEAIGSSLIARKLIREVKAKPGMPVWRHDEDGRPIGLMITKAGQKAIGVEEAAAEKASGKEKRDGAKQTVAPAPRGQAERRGAQLDPVATPRAHSKQALDDICRGEHAPILDNDLFEAVQQRLKEQAVERSNRRLSSPALLTGKLFNDRGNPMTPTYGNKSYD